VLIVVLIAHDSLFLLENVQILLTHPINLSVRIPTAMMAAKPLLLLAVLFSLTSTQNACECPMNSSFGPEIINGTLKSPNFPYDYCNNLHCVYEVTKVSIIRWDY